MSAPHFQSAERPASGGPFWTRHLRREVQFALDIGVLIAAFALAYLLRFDYEVPRAYLERFVWQLPIVVAVQFITLRLCGIYRFVWRYVSLVEVGAFARAAIYSSLVLVAFRVALPSHLEDWQIPRSVLLLDAVLAFGGLLGLRVLRRSLYERFERVELPAGLKTQNRERLLLVGAGRAGVGAIRELQSRSHAHLEVVGFVDDDPAKARSLIQGVPVLGTVAEIPRLVEDLGVDRIVITIARAGTETVRSIVERCRTTGARVQIVPGIDEILQGAGYSRFRDLQIEDLLGREPVELEEETLRSFLTGKSVLVTGAGGSIGSELCRQLLRFSPRLLTLVERSEAALFEVDRDLSEQASPGPVATVVADSGDRAQMEQVFASNRPDVVLHAAAHKHVPLMEENPEAAVRNNVFGTEALAHLCGEQEIASFVLVSTDKAVRPSSIMGASKRLAELITLDCARRYPSTRFVAVRFGNVLGSAGSVVPIFRHQIERGGPVTVTHPDAHRYFMTIPEAGQLVLQAGAIGENGNILVLDMGTPVSISDLAAEMIRLAGLRPFEDVTIAYTGLRPGEKLTEEIQLDHEDLARTLHPKILSGNPRPPDPQQLATALEGLRDACARGDEAWLRQCLTELLPESSLAPPEGPSTPSPTAQEEYLN